MSTTSDTRPLSAATPRVSRRRLVLLVIGLFVLLMGCWCGLLVRDALAFKADFDQLNARLSATAAGTLDLKTLRDDMTSLHADLLSLRSTSGPLLWIAPYLGWLPLIGNDVQAAPELLASVIDFLDAGEIALDAIAPIWPPQAVQGESGLETMLRSMIGVAPQLDAAREPLQRAVDRLAAIDVTQLSPGVRAQLDRITPLLPLLDSGFELLDAAPDLFGFDRPKTYIVLVQNEDELRATGGFISAVVRVTFDHGSILDLDMRDSYQVDDFAHKPYDAPPQPLQDFMGSQLWLFRDANWWPDFPASAQKAAELYTYGLDVPVDGVIGVNQQIVQDLLGAIGPIEVEAGQMVGADNLVEYMRASWDPPEGTTDFGAWIRSRKDFVGRLANAMLVRIQSAPGEINWVALGRVLLNSLERRNLVVWIPDPAINNVMVERGWDGAVQSAAGDFLMIVDSNLGFNKVNTVVASAATYDVTLHADGRAEVELLINYQHKGAPADMCSHYIDYTLETTYDTLVQTCYWDYLRVLTPHGSNLIEASGHPVPAEYLVTELDWDGAVSTSEGWDKTIFETFFVVERGASLQMRLKYELPAPALQHEDGRWIYSLMLQKQPGAPALPIRVVMHWPDSFSLVSAQSTSGQAGTQTLSIDLALDTDQQVQVVLQDSD